MLCPAGTVSTPFNTVRSEEHTVPDQSLDQQTNPTTATPSATPDQPAPAPTQESVESNVTRASEGQEQQADVTINQDPTIGTGDENADPGTGGVADSDGPKDNYDDENAWRYRALQQEAKGRGLPGDGTRDELVARLRENDAQRADNDSSAGTSSVPTASVDPDLVENGGIQRSGRGTHHAEVLQGLSQERRQAQLAAVREQAERRAGDEEA